MLWYVHYISIKLFLKVLSLINEIKFYLPKICYKKKEFLPFAAAWMELESITQSEISQAVKEKYHMISLIYG